MIFEYMKENENLKKSFNESMINHTSIVMKRILKNYDGFESLSDLVDVGGCLGSNLTQILSKYPHIKGVNFDLPHIVKEAPQIHGIFFCLFVILNLLIIGCVFIEHAYRFLDHLKRIDILTSSYLFDD